jgi:hypothetical protein
MPDFQFSKEPRYCQAKLNLKINPETISTLIPKKALNLLISDDPDPYYVIEEIFDITEKANGIEYTKEFWDSWIAKLNKRPIPGSKDGHTFNRKTPPNDFFTVGGELRKNTVYLKIYIPPEGAKESNENFIRDIKLGVIHFSVVSWTKDIVELDENGWIQNIKAVESMKGERNDAVEFNMGAMEQKVNKKNTADEDKDSSDKDKLKEMEGIIMPENVYSDIIKNLNNQIENGTITKKQLAADLKIEIVTDQHVSSVNTLNEITKILGDKPLEKINLMIDEKIEVDKGKYNLMREELMAKEFGPLKVKVNGEEKDNLKRCAAESHVSTEPQEKKNLEAEIEKAKNDPVVKSISFKAADFTSEENKLKVKVNKSDVNNSENIEL